LEDGHAEAAAAHLNLRITRFASDDNMVKGSGVRAQVRTIERVCEIPHEGPFCDLMWSDPEDIETWAVSPRGAGWLFGSKVSA
jgi:hypothetical protein